MMKMRVDKKGRVTLPKEVQHALSLKSGDHIEFKITEAGVVVQRLDPLPEDPFALFHEWSSEEDCRAYAKL